MGFGFDGSVNFEDDEVNAGYGFVANRGTFSTGLITEFPFFLLRNPVGSGRQVCIFRILLAATSSANATFFTFYYAPTITANGATITPRNLLIGSATISPVALTTSNPTISANGTSLFNIFCQGQATTTKLDLPELLIVPAGQTLLVTALQGLVGINNTFSIMWVER